MSNGSQRLTAWPERAAIALVAMPVALFFAAWFRPLLGVPAAAVTLWAAWELGRRIPKSPLPPKAAWLPMVGVSLFLTWTAGLGGFFQQEWDHNFRNALLHDLIDFPWPVVYETSKGAFALDYYLAWSLLPALVGKAMGWKAATLTVAGIGFTGVFLTILLLARAVPRWRWWIPFVFLLWSGLDVVGWMLRGEFPNVYVFMDAWSYPLWFLSHLTNFYCVSHLMIPAWIVTILLVGRRVDAKGSVALSAFLIPLAPFAAIGVAPFVLWSLFQEPGPFRDRIRATFSPVNVVVPLVFVAMCAPYFLGNQGLGKSSGWFWAQGHATTDTTWIKYSAFWALEILIPAAAIWLTGRRDRLLVLTVAVLCLIPLRSTGISNDWALKVSVPGLFVLTFLTIRALLASSKGWRRALLITVFVVGAATPVQQFWRSLVFTSIDTDGLEYDNLKTFDPVILPSFWERKYVVNFHSRPLRDLPLLDYMLGYHRGGTMYHP